MASELPRKEELINKNERICLEYSYLTIARGIKLARDKLIKKGVLSEDRPMQILVPGAGEFIFVDMAEDIEVQAKSCGVKLPLKVVSKPISRVVFADAYGPEGDGQRAGGILTNIMVNDNRLGEFESESPTLWIDSSVQFSFVRYLNHSSLKTVPIGSPAIFMSINFTSTPKAGRFLEVWDAKKIFHTNKAEFVGIDVETRFRLPIEKSGIDENGSATLQFSEDRNRVSNYYAGLVWTRGPVYAERRKGLFLAAQSQSLAKKELQNILPK